MEKVYPPTYEPETIENPIVPTSKKTAALDKMKLHMSENRGYFLKELIDFVQSDLHADSIHIRDAEVADWVREVDADWGWHPKVSLPLDGKGIPK